MVTSFEKQQNLGVDFDVLIIGAGMSGVAAGWYMKKNCPNKSFAILEKRERIGGTWDLFNYPGIRSDSDLYTFGFGFRPWNKDSAIADGPLIREYAEETAAEGGITPHIRFNHDVTTVSWDSAAGHWRIEARDGDTPRVYTCAFLYCCAGYYSYDQGHAPQWPGQDTYQGQILHPQFWPKDAEWADKQVVVIGSGATAVTIVPAMAEQAKNVVMLQRSPSFVAPLPAEDKFSIYALKIFGRQIGGRIARWKNILQSILYYELARRKPDWFRKQLLDAARKVAGDDFDAETHVNPRYQPWDQRVCVDKDGDLLETVKAGRAEIVTDQIETFTPQGLKLASGRELPADIVVTATGLKLQVMGGVDIRVDGVPVDLAKTLIYKGMMLSGVPNMAFSLGYTNASWTLRAELIARHVCRILNHMDKTGTDIVTPIAPDNAETQPVISLQSGYVTRAADQLPKQGLNAPWRVRQNYVQDKWELDMAAIDNDALVFSSHHPSGIAAE